MKIDTLITKLQDIRNRFGNVEVMIGIDAVSKPEYLYGNFPWVSAKTVILKLSVFASYGQVNCLIMKR